MQTPEHKTTLRVTAALFFSSLLLRLGYFLLAVHNLGFDDFWQWAPDARTYWDVSEELVRGINFGDYWLLRVGPGYGLILAASRALFGDTHLPPILLNIFLGALAPVMIYLLSWRLFSNRAIALIAGTVSTVSLTSIALSCHALTDQPSFTFQAAALLAFVIGLQSGKVKWFVWAGLAAIVATYIRPSGQFWPLLFLVIPLLIPLQPKFRSRWKQFSVASITGLMLLVSILGWSTRNWVKYDLFTFGTNGVHTVEWCLIARAIADHTPGESITSVRDRWHQEEQALLENSDTWFPLYTFARQKISETVAHHPDWVIRSYFRTLEENLRAPNYYPERQITQLKPLFGFLNRMHGAWGAHLLVIMTLGGILWLIIRGEHLAWLLLGATYGYNTAMLGLSFWQGSRLHYQAEMGWAIITAYVAWQLYALLRRKWQSPNPE